MGWTGDRSAAGVQLPGVRSYYVIGTASGCKSRDGKYYEPPGVVSGGHTLGGRHFGVAASNPIRFWDFSLMFEAEAAVFADSAPDGTTIDDVPWTYEHLLQHCRMDHPFLVVDDDDVSSVHYFRPEGASFDEQFRTADAPDYHDAWHLQFRTFFKGAV
jgi:hypothetical protein